MIWKIGGEEGGDGLDGVDDDISRKRTSRLVVVNSVKLRVKVKGASLFQRVWKGSTGEKRTKSGPISLSTAWIVAFPNAETSDGIVWKQHSCLLSDNVCSDFGIQVGGCIFVFKVVCMHF